MYLRKELRPLGQSAAQEQPVFNAPEEGRTAPTVEILTKEVPPPLESLKNGSKTRVELSVPAAPPALEPVQKQKKTVELADPAAQVAVDCEDSSRAIEAQELAEALESSSQPATAPSVAAEPVKAGEGQPPVLEKITKEIPKEIPKLEVLKDGSAPPVKDIPQLAAFNNMEQVYMVLGKHFDSDEVALHRTISEKTIRSLKVESLPEYFRELCRPVFTKFVGDRIMDMAERASFRSLVHRNVPPGHVSRGLIYLCSLVDNGNPLLQEVEVYAEENEIERSTAELHLRQPQYDAYQFAVVKVRIDHDFGSMPLASLMPAF